MIDLTPLYRSLDPHQKRIDEIHREMQKVIDDFVLQNWGLRRGQQVQADGGVGEIVEFHPTLQYMRCKIQTGKNSFSDTTIDRVKPLEEEDGQQPVSS